MYAIVKTGGKQYKVAAGDILVTEKLQGEIGDKVELQAIAVVDGTKVVPIRLRLARPRLLLPSLISSRATRSSSSSSRSARTTRSCAAIASSTLV